jgi:glycosyltransferase involved in cell wall biosynthesis
VKILQISHRVPWPLNEGGTIGIYNYTKGFSKLGCEVTLLALDGKKHNTDINAAKKILSQHGAFEVFPIDTDIKPWAAFVNLFRKESYNVKRFYNRAFDERIAELLQQQAFDVIQIEGTYALPYSETVLKYRNPATIVSLRQHNVEYQIWERLAANTTNPIKKWYLTLLASRLKQFEKEHLNIFDVLVPVTEDDAELFKKLGCKIPVFPSPAGIDTDLWRPSSQTDFNKAYHIGSLEWLPNQEAVRWFLNDIWPKLHRSFPHLEFYLAGKNMPAEFLDLTTPGVHIVGKVEDAAVFVTDKGINLVPLLSGSGIRLKILEAMSAGKVVISTSIGAQGINCTNHENIIIADTPEEFIAAVRLLLSDKERSKIISQNARQLIVEEYSNDIVVRRLLEFYRDCAKI